MDDVAKVGAAEDDAEGAEDLGTLRGNDPSHHGEHADGAERNDEGHHALDDRVEGGDHILRELALFSCREDAAAEKNGDDDDLKHIGGAEGLPEVTGEDADEGIHEVGAGGLLPDLAVNELEGGEEAGVVEDVGEHKADHAGDGSGDEEVRHGLPADGADLLHVAHGDDAVDHRQQDNGNNDELEEVDEDGAEGLEVVGRDLGLTHKVEGKADHDTEQQSNEDLCRQTELFLFHNIHSLLKFLL